MKIPRLRFEPASRLPRVPFAVLISGIVLIVLLVGYEVVQAQRPAPAPGEVRTTCLMRRATGVPCPSCGGTRAATAALQLDFAGAFGHNPLIMSAAVILLVVLLLRLATGQAIRLDLSTAGWTVAAFVLIVLLVANWAWVLRQHGFLSGE